MVRICIVALVGLPASGKTTFCKTILKSSDEFNYIHMCYDDMFTFLPQGSEVTYKQERRIVLRKIEQTIGQIKSDMFPNEGAIHSSSKDFVIICDDNNYYAGMRYEIYKLCKEHQLSFGQIYFPVDLESALTRNSMRGTRAVPTRVIEQMSIRLEVPSKKNQWERNTMVYRSFDHKEMHSFFEMCLENPVNSVCKGDDGLNNHKHNVIHEIDILLRKRIKELLLLQSSDGDLSERAKVLNERRKSILMDAKNGIIPETDLHVSCILDRLLHSES